MSLVEMFAPKQMELLQCSIKESPKILVASGAKRAGKTFIFLFAFLEHVRKYNGKGVAFILGGATDAAIQRNIVDDLEKILGREIKLNKKKGFELWGNMIYVFGGANSDSWKSVRGFTAAGAFLNEGTALHDSFVKEVISRCSYEGARVFIDTNPENPMHFVKTDYIDKSGQKLNDGRLNIKAFHFQLYDNIFLPRDYIDSIEKSTPTGMFYDRDILGEHNCPLCQ
ncbi:MAG: PBSX family phage terminase large subunit [Cetobacterium sp.]